MKDHDLQPGTKLKEKYVIGTALGSGGFGITYIGFDSVLDHQVAIKEFFPAQAAKRGEDGRTVEFTGAEGEDIALKIGSFRKEASLIFGSFDVPGICSIRDYFEENGTAYIVQEYLSGGTLKDHLQSRSRRRISFGECLSLFAPVLKGLCQIHSMGIVHRDISPDNLMLDSEGNLKLIDFGASALGTVLKEPYAAPEQFGRPEDTGPWSDIYSICAVMYEALTGSRPPSSLSRISSGKPLQRISAEADIPQEAEDAILKGMSVSPAERYFYAGTLLDRMTGGRDSETKYLDKARAEWGDAWLRIITEGGAPAVKKRRRITAGQMRTIKRTTAAVIAVIVIAAGASGIYVKTHPRQWLSVKVRHAYEEAGPRSLTYYTGADPEYSRIREVVDARAGDDLSRDTVSAEISHLEFRKLDVDSLYVNDSFPQTVDLTEEILEYVYDQKIGKGNDRYGTHTVYYSRENDVCWAVMSATREYQYHNSDGALSEIEVKYDVQTGKVYNIEVKGTIEDARTTMKSLLPLIVPETYLTDGEIDGLLAQAAADRQKQGGLKPMSDPDYNSREDSIYSEFNILDHPRYQLFGNASTHADGQEVTVTICRRIF